LFTLGLTLFSRFIVAKTGIIENILLWAKFKEGEQLKKTDGSKRERVNGITKLDDANYAGNRSHAHECTLILTEGDSAKTLAVSGLSVVGRDYWGVFPLRGKLLNVRDANHKQIMENQEITNIKKILGLQQGKEYEDVKSLRYGHLMIMTDQDHDGSHIKGLIINFLDYFFPSLLKIPGFLVEFITPIVKVSKSSKHKSFFTLPEYEGWKKTTNEGKGWTIKYYKGLGTSNTAEAKEYFSDMDLHRKDFATCDDEGKQCIDLAFSKSKADARKEWLRNFKEGTFIDHSVDEIEIPMFVNKELILFSMADNIRSIPSLVDGLKPGHRKILFGCFKRKLKGELKVAQLSGYIAEHSAYHHGEQSLQQTIIGMAQTYVGSNNINYLQPNGQFGTRIMGGKDAASARYVFTALAPITRQIFNPNDDNLLNYLDDDGQSIEPTWYVPIVPTVLINGAQGIGTGWSTYIPTYNPQDIVDNLRRLLKKEEVVPMHPWYRDFKGKIEEAGPGRYKVTGIWNKVDDTTLEVTELPIESWTQNYKEFLEDLVEDKKKEGEEKDKKKEKLGIKDYKEYHTDTSVHFVITMTKEQMAEAEKEGIEKKFKLSSTINTTNMVCFDREGRIKKYAAAEDMLREFYEVRIEYYQKRKDHLVGEFTKAHQMLSNKAKFILEITEGKLNISNKKKADVIKLLRSRNFDPFPVQKKVKVAGDEQESAGEEEEEEEDEAAAGGSSDYDYLLKLPISSLTQEKVQKLLAEKGAKEAELQVLLDRTPSSMWETDLDEFQISWEDILSQDEATKKKTLKAKRTSLGAGSKKKAATKKRPLNSDDDDDDDGNGRGFGMDDDEDDDDFVASMSFLSFLFFLFCFLLHFSFFFFAV